MVTNVNTKESASCIKRMDLCRRTRDCIVLKNHSHRLRKGGMLRCLVFWRLDGWTAPAAAAAARRFAVAAGGLVAAGTRTAAETEFPAIHTAAAACQGLGPPQNTEHRGTTQNCGDPVSRSRAEGAGGEFGSDTGRESSSGSGGQQRCSAPPPLGKERAPAASATATAARTAVAETCQPHKDRYKDSCVLIYLHTPF